MKLILNSVRGGVLGSISTKLSKYASYMCIGIFMSPVGEMRRDILEIINAGYVIHESAEYF